MKYLLDTHAWIWWNANPARLSKKALNVISSPAPDDELLLSAISLWEFCKLLEKGRLGISCDAREWIREALAIPMLRMAPITADFAYESTVLPGQFHDDPADQIIVATARLEDASIVTRDARIRRYRHVRSVW